MKSRDEYLSENHPVLPRLPNADDSVPNDDGFYDLNDDDELLQCSDCAAMYGIES